MPRPRIFTAAFWTRRIDALTENVPRMFRTGAQTTLTGLALSDAGPINGFDLDYGLGLGFFAGGCLVWLLTTLATPPRT